MITGLYGCPCHPFPSWEQCELFHKRKFKPGDKIKQRHTGKDGIISEQHECKGFYIVKYGERKSDLSLEHAAMLEPK